MPSPVLIVLPIPQKYKYRDPHHNTNHQILLCGRRTNWAGEGKKKEVNEEEIHREGVREGGREGGRERGREEEREGGRKRGREGGKVDSDYFGQSVRNRKIKSILTCRM